MKDTVNLVNADTNDARASRDWLIGKINDFENDEVFPVSYPGIHIAFSSFARRTKIRPLDDIDLIAASKRRLARSGAFFSSRWLSRMSILKSPVRDYQYAVFASGELASAIQGI